ncbi:MAG: tryptophan synthase subunit alpha [Clostridia bacterium]
MHRINSKRTKKLVRLNSKILVGYLLAGYKDKDNFNESLSLLEGSSIGILEIGFPSKNPYADGEIIANAHKMVNYEEATSIEYWRTIRKSTNKVIWLMAYYKDFIENKKYVQFVEEGLIDGLVIPDTDIETRIKLQKEIKQYKVDVIGFVNPLMEKEEINQVLDNFVLIYEQLYVGQTGKSQTKEVYHEMLKITCEHGKTVPFAGFGINSYASVKKVLNEGFRGAIIGTEIIKRINQSSESLQNLLNDINKAVE